MQNMQVNLRRTPAAKGKRLSTTPSAISGDNTRELKRARHPADADAARSIGRDASMEDLQRQDARTQSRDARDSKDARESSDARDKPTPPTREAAVPAAGGSGGDVMGVDSAAAAERRSERSSEHSSGQVQSSHVAKDQDRSNGKDNELANESGLPRSRSADSLHSRGSKRPRTDSPRTDSPGVHRDVNPEVQGASLGALLPSQADDSAEFEQVVAQASTMSDLVAVLLSSGAGGKEDAASSKASLWGVAVSVSQVLKVMQCIVELKEKELKQTELVAEEEVNLIDEVLKCLEKKCGDIKDIQSVLLAINLVVLLTYRCVRN